MSIKEPEWTAENMNRKKGDTNFEICGWCEHASCGSCRYGCYLSTSCSLCASYGIGHDVVWDTPCIVNSFGKTDFASIVQSKKYEIKERERAIKELKKEIITINTLSAAADNTPPLPSSRVHDYYNVSDALWVFWENKWNKGICVSGYRHQDGCVSYVLDDYPKSKEGWGCGYSVPCVLKDWEYEYFRQNLKAFRQWLDFADKKYNGEKLEVDKYYKAMEKS